MRPPARRTDDAGFSLAELIVYSMILLVVLTMTGTLLVRSLTTQRDVRAVTSATDEAQLASRSVERGVRNAAAVGRLTSPAGEMLVVRTRVASPTVSSWRCQAWFVGDALGGGLYTRSVAASGAGTPAIAMPTSATDLAGWTKLATGVRPGATGGQVFTVSGRAVSYAFSVPAGAKPPVTITTQVTALPQGETGSTPCW